jgi:hypothetical protein
MNIKCHAGDLPPIHKTQNSLDDYSKKKKDRGKKNMRNSDWQDLQQGSFRVGSYNSRTHKWI